MENSIYDLLKAMVEKEASDLHVTTGSPPQVRVRGELFPLDENILDPQATRTLLYSILTEAQKHKFELNFAIFPTMAKAFYRYSLLQ